MLTAMIDERVDTLVIAIAVTKRAKTSSMLVRPLARFAPVDLTPADWLAHTAAAAQRLAPVADKAELSRRLGLTATRTWPQLADKVLPALALGVAADDTRVHAKLAGRDGWAAAIAGRVLGVWTSGPPPSLGGVCDAYTWQQLGLAGTPKRCPPEVRAVFIQRSLGDGGGGQPAPAERLVRLVATTAIGAQRPDVKAMVEALVRCWLAGSTIGPATGRRGDSFVADVLRVANSAEVVRFGDRKVFVASLWDQLRKQPAWASLSLDDLKSRLVAAHHSGQLALARADLVAAMDPTLVAASQITADGASFHFVIRETP